MAKAEAQPDPIGDALDEAGRLYVLLAGKVEPAQGEGGRRPAPASRPPLQVDPVSLMAELEQFATWWIGQAKWILQPVRRIDITKRTGALCPWCQGGLVAWLHEERAEPGEVACTTPTHHEPDQPYRWLRADWPRLGVLIGAHDDNRYGPQLHIVHDET